MSPGRTLHQCNVTSSVGGKESYQVLGTQKFLLNVLIFSSILGALSSNTVKLWKSYPAKLSAL